MNRVQTTFQSSSLSASPIVFHFVSIKIIKISPNTTSFSTHRDSGSEFPCQFYTSHFLPQISCYPEKSPLVNLSQSSETWSLSFLCFCPLTSLAEWATARVINIYLLLTLYDQLQLAKRLFLVVYCRLTDGTVNLKLVFKYLCLKGPAKPEIKRWEVSYKKEIGIIILFLNPDIQYRSIFQGL